MDDLITKWKTFWFEPISPYPLSIFRIAFGFIMLVNLLGQYLPFYSYFYGPDSLISINSIYAYKWQLLPVFDLMAFLPQQNSFFLGFLFLTIIFCVFLMVGFATRISTIALFLCVLSLNNHSPFVIHAGDNYARLILLFLVFSPTNKVLSIDSYLKGGNVKNILIEPLSQRLIQIQLCFIYLINWLSKMDSQIWVDGQAVYYATRLQQYFRFPYPQFLDNVVAVNLLTWSTLLVEFALIFLLWPKKTRYVMILIGVIFHLSLDLFFNLGVFEWFFIVSFLLFVEPQKYKEWLSKLSSDVGFQRVPEKGQGA